MRAWFEQDYIRPYVRLLARILLTLLALVILSHLIPAVLAFFMPFILAFFVAAAMNPLICLLQRKLNAPRSASSVLMVAIAILLVVGILGGFIYALAREVVALAQNIDVILEYITQSLLVISAHLYWVMDYMPTDTEDLFAGIMDGFVIWIQTQGTVFADTVITQTATVAGRIGGGVISVIIFIMAAFFIMIDFPRLAEKVRRFFSPKTYKGYVTIKDATLSALGGYLRAQLLMALVTFGISLVALLIIRQEFALLIALILGFLDLLPIVGTAVVLVPWAIVSIVAGEVARGIYLMSLSLVAFLIRRIIEPKIVGSQMGLPPLVALASIYIGMQVGGVWGLILGPIVAMMFMSLYKVGLFDGWIRDINAVLNLLRKYST